MSRHGATSVGFRLAASSLIAFTAIMGSKPAVSAAGTRKADKQAEFSTRLAQKVAGQAAQAMAAGEYAQAIDLAEQVVAAVPDDAGYRTLLGQAYLRAGRFHSADQAFSDVIRLMPDNDKARVAQAVARIALGNREGALAVLSEVTNAPADDFGLALALAGDTDRALAVLEPSARGMRGTSRTRQNLALAYALAGKWEKARAVAAQDVSPADIDRRMESWAQLASPTARNMQVASLLGTKPVAGDPGQPMMLALSQPKAAGTEVAAIAVPAQPAASFASAVPSVTALSPVTGPVAVPAMPQMRVSAAASPVVLTAVPPAPVIAPAMTAAPAPTANAQTVRAAPVGPSRSVAALTTMTRVSFEAAPLRKPVVAKGEWVVQLAAYSNPSRVEAGWLRLSDRFKRLAQYTPSHSVYTVKAKGAVFHRLSVAGFASRTEAAQLCQSVKVRGGNCYVRKQSNDAPIQMVSRDRRQLAAL